MRLSELVLALGGERPGRGSGEGADPELRDAHVDSRRVGPAGLFCALPGHTTDGARFVPDALGRGASAVLAPRSVAGAATLWVHPDARRVAGEAAALLHGRPTRAQTVIAVTGTNGKTSVAHLAAQLLAACGRRPGVVGTLGAALFGRELAPTEHTTPDATELQRLAARNRDGGGDALVLEASSHALDQERLAGTEVDVAVFTNLSRDHLDYHGDLEAYAAAKARLFRHLVPGGVAAIHADDPWSGRMVAAARDAGARVVTFGTGSRCDLCASPSADGSWGSNPFLQGMGIPRTRSSLPLVARHEIENALAAAAAVLATGASPSRVLEGLASVTPPRGRLEPVACGDRGFRAFVDYAHTPDALERVLAALRETLDGGRLVCVFGCGGERDPGKRGPMGAVAARLADVAIVTSDNPRGEDPAAIADAVVAGARGAADARAELEVELDRRAAIRRALAVARPGDVVLVAGKGHETWQALRGERRAFDDRLVIAEELP